MKKVAVGSLNPVKVNSVRSVTTYEVAGYDVPSGVSDQPWGDEETIDGAKQRAFASLEKGDADIGIGLEGGVYQIGQDLFVCNWGVLVDGVGKEIVAGGARFPLPEEIKRRVIGGEELGPVMSDFASRAHVNKKEGAIGIVTKGAITRTAMYEHIVSLLFGQYDYYRN
ncbi:DUF84 family protein [Guptibacillus algicola]|uniref:DUF84 family protein n=1 Tax=Guptibacillus algicola TaxID=225844 RepID=UPI001CD45B72|nr:DUF84 family protein [Alkalihalobacillus algicola]MCA0986397.1 DUF84 family protein [Alkalihalobacillus algicola]